MRKLNLKLLVTLFVTVLLLVIVMAACTPTGKTTPKEIDELIQGENDPDFSSMNSMEWYTYEWQMDESTILTDITSYNVEYVRNVLIPIHTTGYIECVQGVSNLPEDERIALVKKLHNARMNTPRLIEPEAKRIYLWPEGKVPSVTEYTENPDYLFGDAPGFKPFMLECLLDKSVQPKGAVILCAGGGRNCRCNLEEGVEVANALNALSYQCFIVNYRINPYTVEESALDIARAVRIVRANAEKYRIEEDKIACAGFSAGGSVITAAINGFCGNQNASMLVESYSPDELDAVSADINAYLSIYGNYDPDALVKEKFPSMFFAIGGEDGWEDVTRCFDTIRDAGIYAEVHTFAGAPHGFGAGMSADGTVYANASTWPSLADAFMQDVYAKADTAEETEGNGVTK